MALPKILEKFNQYIPMSGGTMTGAILFKDVENVISTPDTNHWIRILAGPEFNNGARLSLAGKDTPGKEGQFYLVARDGTTESSLVGTPSGTLTWNGVNVERVTSSGTNWIRYESGLQIVWGSDVILSPPSITKTFGAPFLPWGSDITGMSYSILAFPYAAEGNSFVNTLTVNPRPESAIFNTNDAVGFTWCAVGKWK